MLEEFIVLVKGQIAHYDNQIARFSPSHPRYRPEQIALYRRLIAEHRDLLTFLEGQRTPGQATIAAKAVVPKSPTPDDDRQSLSPNDLSDLPPELLAELSDSARGEVDPLIQIIRERGGTATLDDILIDLYRKHREIGKRNVIANKLYRLTKRKLCWSVPGKKGIYTIAPLDAGDDETAENSDNENSEGPDGGTSEPSISTGVAGLPDGPSKPSPVGSTPTTSTKHRRELLAGVAIPPVRVPR
jgi:hypothetical protein